MLTELALKAALRHQSSEKRSPKLFDGGGLFLANLRYWRLKYRFGGREKLLSFGIYPEVSLKLARERRDAARQLLIRGVDPSEQRKAAKASGADTFKAIGEEWYAKNLPNWSESHAEKVRARLDNLIYPKLGKRAIRNVDAAEVLPVLRAIESRTPDTAHRAHSDIDRIFRYAVATGRTFRNVSTDLRGSLAPVVKKHFSSITDPAKIGALLRAIDGYSGQPSTEYALKLLPLVFVRPGELRWARWDEFDSARAEWRIPAARMKARELHIVPLSRQVIALLEKLEPLTGSGELLFPSVRSAKRPISDNTINAALRRLGYDKNQIVAHGFRSMASTLLNEQGFAPDVIELQLAHAERNSVRAAYNRAQRLEERRQMMQAWADYLDQLRAQAQR